jgi:hypothetical protein
MQIAIDEILKKSPRPPIILIQGDHGPGSRLIRDSVDRTCLFERISILSAYYLPDSALTIPPDISPVNSFRLVLDTYFGADLDLLPDRTYFSPQSWPYDFTDVTDKAETSCTP